MKCIQSAFTVVKNAHIYIYIEYMERRLRKYMNHEKTK